MSKTSFVLAALTAVAVPLATAHADTKALTAAKANLPDGANVIVGMNVASITGSKLFQTMWPVLLAKAGDAREGVDLAKTACKIDVLTAITDVVVAVDKANEKGAVFIGVKGIDQAKLESCVKSIGAAKKKPVPTFAKIGNVIEVTPEVKGKDKKYYAWIGADVIAIATEGDKDSLAKWTGGKGAFSKTSLGALVAKATTSGAAWGATTQANTLQPGVDMKSGYGWMTMDKGTLNAELHATMGDAKSATSTADMANKQITAIKGSGQIPPTVATMLGNVKVTAAGSDVVVKAGMNEKDISGLLGLLLKM
ncbi:MAG: hypothetical protein H0T79_14585 [Deltaproteobacteria bacterium]|nr:hypothetical protein [Deltaproteobacteria bacterium]